MLTNRSAVADWQGNVVEGSGSVTVGDGVFSGSYSYDSRFGEGGGTNPEQLIAAARASCFTMALSNLLSNEGFIPESLHTEAHIELRNVDGGPSLARSVLNTEGRVSGRDEGAFRGYAEKAKELCRYLGRWRGIPEIALTAKLL